jgi:hypothetical protein
MEEETPQERSQGAAHQYKAEMGLKAMTERMKHEGMHGPRCTRFQVSPLVFS